MGRQARAADRTVFDLHSYLLPAERIALANAAAAKDMSIEGFLTDALIRLRVIDKRVVRRRAIAVEQRAAA